MYVCVYTCVCDVLNVCRVCACMSKCAPHERLCSDARTFRGMLECAVHHGLEQIGLEQEVLEARCVNAYIVSSS